MTNFFQTLVSGLSLGSIYALIALGYTMVYGIAKMLNFAHGDIIMVGAYSVIATAMISQNIPGLVAVVISIAVCTLLGVTIEFFAYRPLRKSPSLAVLITAIGISYLLQNLALLIFGSEQKSFRIDFFSKTRMGKAMRAVSEDREAAELMGINVNRTITLTFAIGSALAAVASIFYGGAYTYIRPTTGSMPGIKAFTAAVFGGIGSIPGAMLGGVMLGVIEKFAESFLPLWSNAIVFLVLIVVLVVKPTGLLGKKISEKV